MKVRVTGRYYLNPRDIQYVEEHMSEENHLRPGQKLWWVSKDSPEPRGQNTLIDLYAQGITDEDRVGTKPLDLVLDLEPGLYTAGCGGAFSLENEEGRPIRERVHFAVFPNGVVEVYNRFSEKPSWEDFQNMILLDPSLAEPPTVEADIGSESVMDFVVYPNPNQRWCVLRDTFTDDNETCDFIKVKTEGSGTLCDNCTHGIILYCNSADISSE